MSEADSSTGDGCVSASAAFAFRLPFYKREGQSPAPRLQPVSPDALSAPRALPCGAGTSTGLHSLPGKEDMAGEGSERRDVFLLLESFL